MKRSSGSGEKPARIRRKNRITCIRDEAGNYVFPGGQIISANTAEWLRLKHGIREGETEKLKQLIIQRYIHLYLNHPFPLGAPTPSGAETQQKQQSVEI